MEPPLATGFWRWDAASLGNKATFARRSRNCQARDDRWRGSVPALATICGVAVRGGPADEQEVASGGEDRLA